MGDGGENGVKVTGVQRRQELGKGQEAEVHFTFNPVNHLVADYLKQLPQGGESTTYKASTFFFLSTVKVTCDMDGIIIL